MTNALITRTLTALENETPGTLAYATERRITVRSSRGITRQELRRVRESITWDEDGFAVAPDMTCDNPF